MHNYKNLKVWQKSMDLVEVLYLQTNTFPDEERYGLTSQLRRASVSIPSNIAEVETQIELCRRLQLLNNDTFKNIMNQTDEIEKMIIGYMKTLL
jgi:hypothetical protein